MTTKKVMNQTVYFSEVLCIEGEPKEGSIKRMALHPMVVEDEGIIDEEFRDAESKDRRFPFRVVFQENGKWRYSCLGADVDDDDCDCEAWNCDCKYYGAGSMIGDGTIDEALRWLLEGEANMEPLKWSR